MMSNSSEESALLHETSASDDQKIILSDTTRTCERQEARESISNTINKAGHSLKESITSLGDKAKAITEEKVQILKDKLAESISPTRRDAHDIQALGATVQTVITVFEQTMTYIEKQEHDRQKKLLNGYRKLLEVQINATRSRLDLVKRL